MVLVEVYQRGEMWFAVPCGPQDKDTPRAYRWHITWGPKEEVLERLAQLRINENQIRIVEGEEPPLPGRD